MDGGFGFHHDEANDDSMGDVGRRRLDSRKGASPRMCFDCYEETVAGTSLEGRRHMARQPNVRRLTQSIPKLLVGPGFFNPMLHAALNSDHFEYEYPKPERGWTDEMRDFTDAWGQCDSVERAIAMSVAVRDYEPALEWI